MVTITLIRIIKLIERAEIYGNEEEIGQAIKDSNVDRKKIFITTKLWVSNFKEEDARKSIEESLKKLKTDYIDLILLHAPGFENNINNKGFDPSWGVPADKNSNMELRKSSWKVLESYYKDKKIKSIGLSK